MNKEENILLQYQVRSKTTMGTRYYYFYAETDIENYLNSKNIKYVRYAKDTALNRKQKRILELFRENKQLKKQLEEEESLDSIWKNNGLMSFSYVLFMIILLLISFVLLNDLISSLTLSNNSIISIIGLIIIAFLVRNSLVYTFGVGQVPIKLLQLIRIICLVIGILFISILILSSAIFVIITIAKYKYLNN